MKLSVSIFVIPQLRSQSLFGPRMLAMVGWLKSKAHCSYTTIELWMDDVLQVPVSRGYLAKLCTGVISESLAGAHEQVKQAVPLQAQLGSDETSIKNNGKKHWIWCITAATFSLFHIASSRSREVLEELIGEAYQGHLNFDYFSANCSFAWHFDIKAQSCWAHLILRGSQWWSTRPIVRHNFRRTTCRRTISASCLPPRSSRRTITANNKFATA